MTFECASAEVHGLPRVSLFPMQAGFARDDVKLRPKHEAAAHVVQVENFNSLLRPVKAVSVRFVGPHRRLASGTESVLE